MNFIDFVATNIDELHIINRSWFGYSKSTNNNRDLNMRISGLFGLKLKSIFAEFGEYNDTSLGSEVKTKGDVLYLPENTVVELKSDRSTKKDIDWCKPLEYMKINNRSHKLDNSLISDKSREIPPYIFSHHFNPRNAKSTITILSTNNSILQIARPRLDIYNLTVCFKDCRQCNFPHIDTELVSRTEIYDLGEMDKFRLDNGVAYKFNNDKNTKLRQPITEACDMAWSEIEKDENSQKST